MRRLLLLHGFLAAAAFEPLSWDEAYLRAEDTLGRMTQSLLFLDGLCQRHSFADGLLYQPRGRTASGAPYYAVGGHFLYFDPHCDGNASTPGRWQLAEAPPDLAAEDDLDADGECAAMPHVEGEPGSGPPLGTRLWHAPCGRGGELSPLNVSLQVVPGGEKLTLLKGHSWDHPLNSWYTLRPWWYVGVTDAIPRLDVPSLNFQDAAAGFRATHPGMAGLATVWPSLLAMAATWDPEAVRSFASALGREFRGKGANAVLGPSMNVHRVARNGRNFEYLSGEDPFLGSRLTAAYVQGVQSEGVMAVLKHWVFNQQETNRGLQNSIVDEKTAWELYYPPFQAAVDAGVSAVMCSYNQVNGRYSCESPEQLAILKQKMGFRGFVQSDWWATHSTSVGEGLDQEMPGLGSGSQHRAFFRADQLMQQQESHIDEAAKRVLAAIHRLNLSASTQPCSPPHCKEHLLRNVSAPEHVALARSLAARSVVLLKNEGVLPLAPGRVGRIAIIGAVADAESYDPDNGQGFHDWARGDYYSGGGSGHMAGTVASAAAGLRARAAALGLDVVESLSDNITEAEEAAAAADVALVVLGVTSGESRDRPTLQLDGPAAELVAAARGRAKATVVLIQACGAVLLPWRDSVEGIMIMFLGGQETGHAWADVVFGAQVPEGRLPLALPLTEEDAVAPGEEMDIVYAEGLKTSYRNPEWRAAFPFGFGLTYTTFSLVLDRVERCGVGDSCAVSLAVNVTNAGTVAAPTVLQLYLDFPAIAEFPTPILKGFQKTARLLPGDTQSVVLALTERDVSYFSPRAGGWVPAGGCFEVHVGESSADRPVKASFCLPAAAGGAPGTEAEGLEFDGAKFFLTLVLPGLGAVLGLFLCLGTAWWCCRSSKKQTDDPAERLCSCFA